MNQPEAASRRPGRSGPPGTAETFLGEACSVDTDAERTLVAAFRVLCEANDVEVEQESVKVAVRRAIRAAETDPWRAAELAASDLGLRLRTSLRPVNQLAADVERASVLCLTGDGWLLLEGSNGTTVSVRRGEFVEELEERQLLDRLGVATNTSQIDAGFVHVSSAAGGRDSGGVEKTPFERLTQLFAPERRDIRGLLVFALVVGILNLATPVAVEAIVNTIAFVNLVQPIVVLSLVLGSCLVLAAIIVGLEALVAEMIQRRLFVRVISDLAWRLPRVRRSAFDERHGPELVNRFFDVVVVQKVGAKLLLDGITALLSASIGLLVLAFYHPYLLAFDVVLILSLLGITFLVGRKSVTTARHESTAKYQVADWLQELARHPIPFRNAGGREIAQDHADTLAMHYLDARKRHFRIVFRQLASALLLQAVMSAVLLGLGGWLVKVGELTLGQLVASWLIASLVLAAVAKLGAQLESFYDISAAAAKLGQLFDLPLERATGETLKPSPGGTTLSVEDLEYTFDGRGPLFSGLGFSLEKNATVAIHGPNGSGKSTLVEILHGQRDPSSGHVRVDGIDLRSLRLESARRSIALVQPRQTIQGSIADNVRMRSQLLTLDELRASLEAVGLWDFVQSLPAGVETQLTSDGKPLSETQESLLVLARVIASRPRLLLVDGILDDLDDERRKLVIESLTREDRPWTLVITTRRANVAKAFPMVVELPDQLRGREEPS